ncbi:reverse transcriptase domain-containing protein [Tanacetum coccineum]
MVFCAEKSRVITKEVAEWLKAGIVRPVKYPTLISNPVLVKKADGSWWMCIDFKNINAACPKDYYPLPEIDSKIEAVMGFPLKCFLDAYKGYHLVQRTNGIRANPTKTKDIAEIQSPRTWGEMQSLAGKLAALNRFLSRLVKESLPFFETLKDITKENKHDYRWTEKVYNAFQKLKKMILDLPALKTPIPKETLFVYLAASKEAVSAVLLVVREGKQYLVHHVSRTLHDTERNYTPLEKVALALQHTARRLRRLAQYSVKLGAYNITYEPRSAVKRQILAYFINEVPVGSDDTVPRQPLETLDMPSMDVKEINAVVEEEGEMWMIPITNCLEKGAWPED